MDTKTFEIIDAYERILDDFRLQLWEAEAECRFKGKLRDSVLKKQNTEDNPKARYPLSLAAEALTQQAALADRQKIALRHNLEYYRARLDGVLEDGQ